MARIAPYTRTVLYLLIASTGLAADKPPLPLLIGYTELRTNLPGGRHANVRTKRAMVTTADGTGRRAIAEDLANDSDVWTQFNN